MNIVVRRTHTPDLDIILPCFWFHLLKNAAHFCLFLAILRANLLRFRQFFSVHDDPPLNLERNKHKYLKSRDCALVGNLVFPSC